MITLILYSTAGCHLCEHAKVLIEAEANQRHFILQEVDIADDDALFSQYGWHIPVVKNTTTGRECFWPFDSAQLQKLIDQ